MLVKPESGRDLAPALDEGDLFLAPFLVEMPAGVVVDHVDHDVTVQLERRRLDRAALVGVGGDLLIREVLLQGLAYLVEEAEVNRGVVAVPRAVVLDPAVHLGALLTLAPAVVVVLGEAEAFRVGIGCEEPARGRHRYLQDLGVAPAGLPVI